VPTLGATLALLAYGLMSPLLGVLLPTYALTLSRQGSLGLAQALGMAISSLSAGAVVDLKGNKPALLFGLALLAGSLCAAPQAGSYRGLWTVYFLLGISGGVIVTSANSLVGAISSAQRGPALNFLNLFFGLGGIITTAASSYLLTPPVLCYSVALVAALSLLVNSAIPMPRAAAQARFRLSEIPSLLSQPVLILLSLFLFLYVAAEVSVWIWLKTYLLSLHFSAQAAGGVISYGFALGMLLGRMVATRLRQLPPLVIILVSSMLIGVSSFTVLAIHSVSARALAVFWMGLCMAPVFPTALALAGDRFPHGTATAMDIVITSGWLGLAVSSPLIGTLASLSTLHNALLLLPSLAAAMLAVTLVLRFALRRPVTL
jgi:fucose permease